MRFRHLLLSIVVRARPVQSGNARHPGALLQWAELCPSLRATVLEAARLLRASLLLPLQIRVAPRVVRPEPPRRKALEKSLMRALAASGVSLLLMAPYLFGVGERI